MALLVYSDRCQYSHEILKYIQGQPALSPIIRFWNVTVQGVPHQKITRVPTLVTDEGKMLVGSEVKAWLESMVPCDFESWDSVGYCQNLDGSEMDGDLFDLEKYGTSLQPRITPDLEAKINTNPSQAYQKRSGT
jgi:hypothetical protein